MIETKRQNKHRILSMWIIVCGLLYIFAYQFRLPFKADTFLYGMVVGLVAMTIFVGKIIVSKQVILFILVAISSFIGSLLMALLANYPFALAPGLGLNAYFAYTVVGSMGVSWETALLAVFFEGIIFILLSTFNSLTFNFQQNDFTNLFIWSTCVA